jgi:GTPase SAR1 family protein
MQNIGQLREIAEKLDLQRIYNGLERIKERQQQENKELIIPLVGEFSAGKTSLLNALADATLETHILPTTATIFEIRFGNSEEKAIVINEDDSRFEVSDIDSLKNRDLADAKVVQVFDTSTKVASSTVIVDTPGLSSLEPKHQKALLAYLPFTDVILLVVDIQQGEITSSTLKFIETAELAKKRIYVVIAQCDTKSEAEKQQVKRSIENNTKIAKGKAVCISAKKGQIDELLGLLSEIQKDKNKIVEEVTAQRIDTFRAEMLYYINELLASSKLSTKEIDEKITETKHSVRDIQSKIDRLISELQRKVNHIADDTVGNFNQKIFFELDGIAQNPPQGINLNQYASSRIESVANSFFAAFKTGVIRELGQTAMEQRNGVEGFSLPSLEALISSYQLNKLSYNIDLELPEVQALNRNIAGITKVVGGVALAAATVATAGAALVTAGGVVAGGAVGAGAAATAVGQGAAAVTAGKVAAKIIPNAIKTIGVQNIGNIVDTVSDVASMQSSKKTQELLRQQQEMIQKGQQLMTLAKNGMTTIEQYEQQIQQQIPISDKSKGLIEGLVGKITEHTHAKPQRKRLIDDLLAFSLQPEFKQQMESISTGIIVSVRNTLYEESEEKIKQIETGLAQLKSEKEMEEATFSQKINSLKSFKKNLEENHV